MRGRALGAGLLCLAIAIGSHVANAQYMYLDSNADGENTSADRLNENGTSTLVSVYLDTAHSIDGTPSLCESPAESLTINSYEIILHAEDGAVEFGTYQNLQSTMTTSFGLQASTSDFHAGMGGGTALAPGLYLLCKVTVTGTSGQPTLSIATSSSLGGAFQTSFGTMCSGSDMDNTHTLGNEWFNTAGLASAGGENQSANSSAPSTFEARIGTPTILTGEFASTGSSAVALENLPPGFKPIVGEVFAGRRQVRAYGALPSGTAVGASHVVRWVIEDASSYDTLATTVQAIAAVESASMSQDVDAFLGRGVAHRFSVVPVRRLGGACLPILMSRLRDPSKRSVWSRASAAIGQLGDTAYFDSLHAYIWQSFHGTIDDATYLAIASAQQSLGPTATVSTRVEDYLISGCSPAFWLNAPWRPVARTDFQFSVYMSKMSILALAYCDTQRAANYLASLSTNPFSSEQNNVIAGSLRRNHRVREIGIEAAELEEDRKPGY